MSGAGILPALAIVGGCLGPLCGGVENYSPWPVHWTEFIGVAPGICPIWNKDGGPVEVPDVQHCVGGILNYGEEKGGWNSGVDVDGFTYLDRDYRVNFLHENVSKVVKAGSWTKITTNEWASCLKDESGQPYCSISRPLV